MYKCLKGGRQEDGPRLVSVVPSGRTRGSSYKLEHRKFQMNMRKHFFTVKVVEHWNRLSREAVELLSLEICKTCLGTFWCKARMLPVDILLRMQRDVSLRVGPNQALIFYIIRTGRSPVGVIAVVSIIHFTSLGRKIIHVLFP